jgi:hypothetical protein
MSGRDGKRVYLTKVKKRVSVKDGKSRKESSTLTFSRGKTLFEKERPYVGQEGELKCNQSDIFQRKN